MPLRFSSYEELYRPRRAKGWRDLRAMRSSPPGEAAADSDRAATFTSALEQAEQLYTAAATVGPASQPLLVFYGLAQAGRALAAASPRLTGVDNKGRPAWGMYSHGIQSRGSSGLALSDVVVVADRDGALPRVAKALNSACLPASEEVRLSDLWAALPEAYDFPLDEPARPVLQVASVEDLGPRIMACDLLGAPSPMLNDEGNQGGLAEFLDGYPRLSGWMSPSGFIRATPERGIQIGWTSPDDELIPAHMRATRLRKRVAVRYRGAWYTLPGFGSTSVDVHPLVVWWAVLHALSMLARYQPRGWARIIDVNQSEHAAAAEHLLDEALTAIPELIYEAVELASEP